MSKNNTSLSSPIQSLNKSISNTTNIKNEFNIANNNINKNIISKDNNNSNIILKNSNLDKLLQNYFYTLEKDLDLAYNMFNNIKDNKLFNDDVLFICFWYPFNKNLDDFVLVLLQNNTVKYKDIIIENNLNNLSYTFIELNTYAFKLFVKNKLSIDTCEYAFSVGKIIINLEYIYKLIKLNMYSIINIIWSNNNYCEFESLEFKQIFFSLIDITTTFLKENKNIINNMNRNYNSSYMVTKKSSLSNNINYGSRRESLMSYNMKISNNSLRNKNIVLNKSNLSNNNIISNYNNNAIENMYNDMLYPKEIINLFKNNQSKLTISILMLLSINIDTITVDYNDNTSDLSYNTTITTTTLNNNNNNNNNIQTNNSNYYKNNIVNINESNFYNNNNNNNNSKRKNTLNNNEYNSLLKRIKTLILLDKDKTSSIDIILGLYLIQLEELTVTLLESNLIIVNIDIFKASILNRDMKFVLSLYNIHPGHFIFKQQELHEFLIENLRGDSFHIEIYLYIIKNLLNAFEIKTIKFLIETLNEMLDISNLENSLFTINYNQIKLFILIAELLKSISNTYKSLSYSTEKLVIKLLDFTEELQNNISEDNLFRELMFEKDITGRQTLQIICDNDFLNLLKNSLIEKIITEQWEGMFDLSSSNIMETSNAYKSLFVDSNTKDYDVFTKIRNNRNYKTSFYQFNIWKKHIFSKYFFEIFINFLILLSIHFINLKGLYAYQEVLKYDYNKGSNFGYIMDNNYNSIKEEYNFIDEINSNIKSIFIDKDHFIYKSKYIDILNDNNNNNNNNLYLNNVLDIVLTYNKTLGYNILKSIDVVKESYNNINILIKYLKMDIIYAIIISCIPVGFIIRLIYIINYKYTQISYSFIVDILLSIVSSLLAYFLYTELNKNTALNELNNVSKFNSNEYFDNYNYSTILNNSNNNNNETLKLNYAIIFKLNEFILIYSSIKTNDIFKYVFLIISIYIILLWIKFILLLKATRSIGPLIVIFILSFKGIIIYMLCFILINFIFSLFANFNFYNVNSYFTKNIFYSFVYHFYTSIGSIGDYNAYIVDDVLSIKPYIDYLAGFFTIILNLVNTIVLINIMIALLSNIYENYRINSIQLYIRERIKIRNYFYDISAEQRYGSLLACSFPVNIILFPITLLFLIIYNNKHIKTYNNIVYHLNYLVYFLLYFTIYSIINIILIPLCYVKIVITKSFQLFNSDIQEYFFIYKLLSLLMYIMFGLVIQIYTLLINEIYQFFKHAYSEKVTYIIEKEQSGRFIIEYSTIKSLIKLSLILIDKYNLIEMTDIDVLNEFTCFLELGDRYELCKVNYINKEGNELDKNKKKNINKKDKVISKKKLKLLEVNEETEFMQRTNAIKTFERILFQYEIDCQSLLLFINNFSVNYNSHINDVINYNNNLNNNNNDNKISIKDMYITIMNKDFYDNIFLYYQKISDRRYNIIFDKKLKKFIKNSYYNLAFKASKNIVKDKLIDYSNINTSKIINIDNKEDDNSKLNILKDQLNYLDKELKTNNYNKINEDLANNYLYNKSSNENKISNNKVASALSKQNTILDSAKIKYSNIDYNNNNNNMYSKNIKNLTKKELTNISNSKSITNSRYDFTATLNNNNKYGLKNGTVVFTVLPKLVIEKVVTKQKEFIVDQNKKLSKTIEEFYQKLEAKIDDNNNRYNNCINKINNIYTKINNKLLSNKDLQAKNRINKVEEIIKNKSNSNLKLKKVNTLTQEDNSYLNSYNLNKFKDDKLNKIDNKIDKLISVILKSNNIENYLNTSGSNNNNNNNNKIISSNKFKVDSKNSISFNQNYNNIKNNNNNNNNNHSSSNNSNSLNVFSSFKRKSDKILTFKNSNKLIKNKITKEYEKNDKASNNSNNSHISKLTNYNNSNRNKLNNDNEFKKSKKAIIKFSSSKLQCSSDNDSSNSNSNSYSKNLSNNKIYNNNLIIEEKTSSSNKDYLSDIESEEMIENYQGFSINIIKNNEEINSTKKSG